MGSDLGFSYDANTCPFTNSNLQISLSTGSLKKLSGYAKDQEKKEHSATLKFNNTFHNINLNPPSKGNMKCEFTCRFSSAR
jgi:hypothetical protein